MCLTKIPDCIDISLCLVSFGLHVYKELQVICVLRTYILLLGIFTFLNYIILPTKKLSLYFCCVTKVHLEDAEKDFFFPILSGFNGNSYVFINIELRELF